MVSTRSIQGRRQRTLVVLWYLENQFAVSLNRFGTVALTTRTTLHFPGTLSTRCVTSHS